MTETIESLYPVIGQTLTDAIPSDWSSAWVVVEVKPGVISLQGHFILKEDDLPKSIQIPRQLMQLFSQLHTRMVEEMHDDWKRARFELKRSGKFVMKFEY